MRTSRHPTAPQFGAGLGRSPRQVLTCPANSLKLSTMEEREAAEQRSVEEVVDRLTTKYPGIDRLEIERIVAEEHQAFEGRPVRDFVPVLVEKSAKQRVKALEQA